MRTINQFSVKEWLRLLPLRQALRQIRNDVLLSLYKKNHPREMKKFLAENRYLANKNIILVIAFEQAWALDWLLKMAAKHITDATILVFDNSRKSTARLEIEQVCHEHGTPYLALPPYRTKHVNRSHGMAMTWVFHHIVRKIQPRIFGFVDHDLIPVDHVNFSERLADQPLFGVINSGKFNTWSTWAGYCLFKYDAIKNKQMNFLYDFSRDLDTGGRNWTSVYRELDPRQLRFAKKETLEVKLPSIEKPRLVEVIDQRWIHIGGISYNDNFKEKFGFFNALAKTFEDGSRWHTLYKDPNQRSKHL